MDEDEPSNDGSGNGNDKDEKDDAVIELEARRVQQDARHTEEELRKFFETAKTFDDVAYLVKGRTKRLSRMIEKIRDRQSQDAFYDARRLTDVCGFRVVTLFQGGIEDAVGMLLELAASADGVNSPFVKNGIEEVVVYTSRPETDPLSVTGPVCERVRASPISVEAKVENKRSGYSSVHVIARCRTSYEDAVYPDVAVEFQIRSALEEVWGEADHKLRYESARGRVDAAAWNSHLNALKTLIDGCLQYLEVIKRQSDTVQPVSTSEADVRKSTDTTNKSMERVIGAPAEIIDLFEAAYEVRDRADTTPSERESRRLFAEAAAAFRDVGDRAKQIMADEDPSWDDVRYTHLMEEGYCCLYSDDQKLLKRADAIYDAIGEERPNDAVSRFRHGQVLRRRSQLPRAIERFEAAIDILDQGRDPNVDDKHWVNAAAYRNLGYTYWRASMVHPATEDGLRQRLHTLGQAIEVTLTAHQKATSDEERRKDMNNLIYYGWEERKLNSDGSNHHLDDNTYRQGYEDLKAGTKLDEIADYEDADTLCRIAVSNQDRDCADAAARAVIRVLEKKIKGRKPPDDDESEREVGRMIKYLDADLYLDTDELDAWQFAAAILLR